MLVFIQMLQLYYNINKELKNDLTSLTAGEVKEKMASEICLQNNNRNTIESLEM